MALSKQTKQRGERDIHTHAGKTLKHQLKTYTLHSSNGAMLAVKEERTVIGGVELARKTVVAATDEG